MAHDLLDELDDPRKKLETLDHDKIYFGKHKGKTPAQIAEIDEGYVRWAYETVTHANRPVFCSEALYRDCGGKGKSKQQQLGAQKTGSYTPAKPYVAPFENNNQAKVDKFGFNDMDDDIPF